MTVKITFGLLLLIYFSASAQKLPNVQLASLRAPVNIKVDGKANEWGDRFQAYNKTTEIFYTIANDNTKLYLTIRATDESIIKKIIMGGITFTINTNNKRDTKNAAAITFPVYDITYPPSYFNFSKSKTAMSSNMDSLMNVHNKTLSTKYKLIGVACIQTVTDSLISVYNDTGLKAAALFDNQLNYTYELAIPLKHLNISNKKFQYNIKINAATIDGRKLGFLPGRNIVMFTGADGVNYVLGNDPGSIAMVAPTDFWGEYTLAK